MKGEGELIRPRLDIVLYNMLQDKVEADRSGLWVFKEMLWDIDGREQEVTERAARIKSFKNLSTFLHAAPCHYSHYVSFLRARGHRHHLRRRSHHCSSCYHRR